MIAKQRGEGAHLLDALCSVRLAMWPISEGSISIVGTLATRLWNMRFSEMIEYLEETKTKENDRCSERQTSKKLSKVSGNTKWKSTVK